jgi:hypothetical protein
MLHFPYNVRAAIPVLEIYIVETHKKCKVTPGKEQQQPLQNSILFSNNKQTELGAGFFFQKKNF